MDNFYKLLVANETTDGDEKKKLQSALLEKIAANDKKRADDLQKRKAKMNEEQKIIMDVKKEDKRVTVIRHSLRDVKDEFNDEISRFEEVKQSMVNLPDADDLVIDDEEIDTCSSTFKNFNQFLESATERVAKKRSKYDPSNVFGTFFSEKDVLKLHLEENSKNYAKFKASRESLQAVQKEVIDKSTDNKALLDEDNSLKVELVGLEEEHSACNEEIAEKNAALVQIEFSEAKLNDDSSFDEEFGKLKVLKETADASSAQIKLESENLTSKFALLGGKLSETQKLSETMDLEIKRSEEQLTNLIKQLKIKELLKIKENKINEKRDELKSNLRQVLENERNSTKSLREKSLHGDFASLKAVEKEVSKLTETLEKRDYEKEQLEDAKLKLESKFGGLIAFGKPRNKKTLSVNRQYASEKEEEENTTVVLNETEHRTMREDFSTPRKTAATQRGPSHVSIDPFEQFEKTAPILTSTPLILPAKKRPAVPKQTTAPKKRAGRGRGRPAKRGK